MPPAVPRINIGIPTPAADQLRTLAAKLTIRAGRRVTMAEAAAAAVAFADAAPIDQAAAYLTGATQPHTPPTTGRHVPPSGTGARNTGRGK